jgi:hypothetical protein
MPPGIAPASARLLDLRIAAGGGEVVSATQRMAAVPVATLGVAVADLPQHRDGIVDAIGFLMQGARGNGGFPPRDAGAALTP